MYCIYSIYLARRGLRDIPYLYIICTPKLIMATYLCIQYEKSDVRELPSGNIYSTTGSYNVYNFEYSTV